MSEPTAPSAAQGGAPAGDDLPPAADIYADVDPTVPRDDPSAGTEPDDAGLGC